MLFRSVHQTTDFSLFLLTFFCFSGISDGTRAAGGTGALNGTRAAGNNLSFYDNGYPMLILIILYFYLIPRYFLSSGRIQDFIKGVGVDFLEKKTHIIIFYLNISIRILKWFPNVESNVTNFKFCSQF